MKREHLHILRHAIGLDEKGIPRHDKGDRNYYCVGLEPGDKGQIECRELVAMGFMEPGQTINEGRDQYFHVTEAGRAAAVRGVTVLPLKKSQRIYRVFLRVRDAWPDMSFRDFLTDPRLEETRRTA